MKTLLAVLFSLVLAGVAHGQLTCMTIGKFVSCDGPNNQNSTQHQMGPNWGTITDSQGNLETYRVLPSPGRPSPFTVPSPQAPQPPRAPSFPAFDPSPFAPAQPVEPISPVFAPFGSYTPYSFGGDAGQ
jgi:hypothetical protein